MLKSLLRRIAAEHDEETMRLGIMYSWSAASSAIPEPEQIVVTPRPARAAGLARLLAEVARHATVLSTVGTSFAVLLLQTVQALVLARMLGPAGRGEYASAILYTTLLTYIGLAGTHLAVARRAARHRGSLVELQRTSLRTGLLTGTLTLAVVAALGWTALPAAKSFLAPLCVACALAVPFEHVRLGLMAIDQGSGRFARYNACLLWNACVFPLLLVVLWATGRGSVTTAALATIATPLAGLAFLWILGGRWNPLGTCCPAPCVASERRKVVRPFRGGRGPWSGVWTDC